MRKTRKRSSDARAPVRRVQSLPAGMLARGASVEEVSFPDAGVVL
jgi:hypothetical protein